MGTQQRLRRSYIENDIAGEGQVYTFQLPRNYDVEKYMLRIQGSANVTTAFTAARAEAPFPFVRRIEIIADGRSTLVSQSGVTAAYNPMIRQAPLSIGTSGARIVPLATVGLNPFAMIFDLPRAMFDGLRPKDTNFRTSAPNTIELRITMGNCADMFTGAGVGTVQNLLVSVFADEISESKDKNGMISAPQYLLRFNEVQVAALSTNSAQQIKLPVNTILRYAMIRQSINGEPTDALINRVQIKRGLDVRFSRAARDARYENTIQQGYPAPTGLLTLDFGKTPAYMVKINDCWNLDGSTDSYLELDVSGVANGEIRVVTCELVKIRR
jgi:hypothetical protein